jgi:putative AlgH/UPF0301 family transcriptional regulator
MQSMIESSPGTAKHSFESMIVICAHLSAGALGFVVVVVLLSILQAPAD